MRCPLGTRKRRLGLRPCASARRTLVGVQLAAGAGVARRPSGGQLRAPRQIQLELAAEARIGQLLALEPLEVLLVERRALRLAVGSMRTGAIRSLVPFEPQPRKIGAQRGHHGLLGTLRIGILDAQHETAGVLARQQEIEQRRARIAEVQCAAGAGRKARDDGGFRHCRTM